MPVDTEEIKRRRTNLGLSMAEAAKAAKMNTAQQWNGIESGERKNPSIDTMERIAKALKCKVDDLLS